MKSGDKSKLLKLAKEYGIFDSDIIAQELGSARNAMGNEILDSLGISSRVVNMHTLKPCDYNAIDLAISSSKAIITVEEHSIIGGLGSIVAEYKAKFTNSPAQLILGLPDKFGKTAEYRFLLEKYRLVGDKIAIDIQEFLQKKG